MLVNILHLETHQIQDYTLMIDPEIQPHSNHSMSCSVHNTHYTLSVMAYTSQRHPDTTLLSPDHQNSSIELPTCILSFTGKKS